MPPPSGPPGSTGPITGPPGRQGPPSPEQVLASARQTARRAQLLALVALAAALIAILASMTALARQPGPSSASSLSTVTSTAAPASEPSTKSSSERPSTAPVTDESSAGTSVIDTRRVTPDADFQPVYEHKEQRVQPPAECGALRYVDVDEPRVGVTQETAEFGYGKRDCSGGAKAQIDVADGLPISLVDNELATAKDCAEAIQNGPVNEPLVPTDKTRLCMITSDESAKAQGTSQKVVLVVVTGISQDGTMVIQLTAWAVPH